MLLKEMVKPQKELKERVEIIKAFEEKEEFQTDEEELIKGEEDILLADNKAATLILTQESGSWRTRHLRVRASSLKQRMDLGRQKVRPGRSTLADLNAKSHPRARLASLRRSLSIECIDQRDQTNGEVLSSDCENQRSK